MKKTNLKNTKLRKGCYNVRVTVDEDGTPEVGFVHRLYGGDNAKTQEWKDAPESTRDALGTALFNGAILLRK